MNEDFVALSRRPSNLTKHIRHSATMAALSLSRSAPNASHILFAPIGRVIRRVRVHVNALPELTLP